MNKKSILVEKKDYSQSANKVYHFMDELNFLEIALKNKALSPRYCQEDIRYLNLPYDNKIIKSLYILQKCFCDIPKSSLFNINQISINKELLNPNIKLTEVEENNLLTSFKTHCGLYGNYGISFSKKWAEENKLQPIHYINEKALDTKLIQKVFSYLLNDSLEDFLDDYFINELIYKKPIRGTILRDYRFKEKQSYLIPLIKNFYNEQEWRFVPDLKFLQNLKIESIIYKPSISRNKLIKISNNIQNDQKFKDLWLNFNYSEIEEIIVSDKEDVKKLIKFIELLDENLFIEEDNITKNMLISKITTLEDIGDDYGKAY